MFSKLYKDQKVLITGHTGFKGSWLTAWLLNLGAKIVGVSKDIPTTPALFDCLQLKDRVTHYLEDIRDLEKFKSILNDEQPDFVFHLAAQPIVSEAYKDPVETISSNTMGTAHVLEALRLFDHQCVAVMITSDKVYDNIEQIWGYKENDRVGGKDIYSGSKGAAEFIIKSYFHSFFNTPESKIRLGIGRAGNVIGGGDWAKDRIVVDCMRAWSEKKKVSIRSPQATRPWQHVLEPLSGYLTLGAQLLSNNKLYGEAFNFGPRAEQNKTVLNLLESLSRVWHFESSKDAYDVIDNIPFHEAGLLKLNCDKALSYLHWQACLDYEMTVEFTGSWYYDYYQAMAVDMWKKTLQQINQYERLAKSKGLLWME